MMLHLFVTRDRQHYLFGDFHAAEYAAAGIRPWFEKTNLGTDPLLAFHARQMSGVDLMARLQSWHRFFQDNPSLCPPRTLADFPAFVKQNANNPHAMASLVVANLNETQTGNASQIVLTSGSQPTGTLPASSIPGIGQLGVTGIGSNIPGAGFTNTMSLPSVNGLGGIGGMSLPGVGGVGGGVGGGAMSLPGVGGIGGGGLGLPGVGGLGGGAGGLGLPSTGGVGLGGLPKP
jgi:hypothetical protein